MSWDYIAFFIAHQLLCARITADMHTHNTCCACVYQVLGGDSNCEAIQQTNGVLPAIKRLLHDHTNTLEQCLHH